MAVNATAIWRIRPSGSNTNGGGFDPAISGAGTDYSRQNSAQASGTHGTAAGTATFTDLTAAAFTLSMIGNALYITGTGFTTGWYFVVGYTSSTVVTLDRSPGTGTATGTWNLGGGWADLTNLGSAGPSVNLNVAYVLGSGIPNPSSYVYDYDITSSITLGASITIANDPGTPNYLAPPNTTGGMPVMKFDFNGNIINTGNNNLNVNGLWFVGSANSGTYAINGNPSNQTSFGVATAFGCVFDQLSYDIGFIVSSSVYWGIQVIGCEVFSSVASGSPGNNAGIDSAAAGSSFGVIGCNIHDCVGFGVLVSNTSSPGVFIEGNIIANCQQDGIKLSGFGYTVIKNNTIDGNLGNGINITTANENTYNVAIFNNILSNHSQSGKYGIDLQGTNLSGGIVSFIDYNVYYNNTTDLNNLSYGPHDTHGGLNPYINQSTENYSLK